MSERGVLRWRSRAAPNPAIVDFALVSYEGKLYTFGGFTGTVVADVQVFDPATDTWTKKASMPTPRMKAAAAEVGGNIYVIGGFTADSPDYWEIQYRNVTEVYSPATDSWSTAAPPPLPTPVNRIEGNQFVAAAALDGTIYVVLCDSESPALLKFEPPTGTWTSLPGPGYARNTSVAVLNGRLFVASIGTSSGGDAVAEYDRDRALWIYHPHPRPSCPTYCVTTRPTLVTYAGALYAIGGFVIDAEGPGGGTDDVSRFDVALNEWQSISTLPRAGHSFGAAEAAGKLYVLGGSSSLQPKVPMGELYEVGLK